MTKTEIDLIKNRILGLIPVTPEEALSLSQTAEIDYLCRSANEIRKHFSGNFFDLCSITNARSGKCPEDCKWCSQSAFHHTDIEIYDLVDKEAAVQQARNNYSKGVHKYSLVTSGRTVTDQELDQLIDIYREIRKDNPIHLCASMGLLNKQQLQKLKDNGIIHYHCNLETAPSFFPELCSTHLMEEKFQTIRWAKEVGLEICSGGIIGMGETMKQRIELAFELKKLNTKSIPLNFLNPIAGTALENAKPLTDNEILVTIALFRFINPEAMIRFAGGRNIILHFEEKALNAGINAALVGDLLTTIGKNIDEDLQSFINAGLDIHKKTADSNGH
jgi:biotin synthase